MHGGKCKRILFGLALCALSFCHANCGQQVPRVGNSASNAVPLAADLKHPQNNPLRVDVVLFKNASQILMPIADANKSIQVEQIDFCRTFINQGDLVFDVGASCGDKTEIYLACGAKKVICFEPEPVCVNALRRRFTDKTKVVIEPVALGAKEERREMFIHGPGSVINTLSKEYTIQSRFADRNVKWNGTIMVDLSTLDLMIKKYGVPKFCKIDVENFELEVLNGLTAPIPYLSFECNTDQLKTTVQCLERLKKLGYDQFNYAIGERGYLISPKWMSSSELLDKLHSLMKEHDFSAIWGLWGDVYAKHGS